MVWPAIIAGGAALIGGALANRSNRKVADQTNALQQELSAEQTALQREFAQSGVQWRVEDAKAAGLHPLYALGGQITPYTPQAMQLMTPDQSALGRGIAEAGQSLGRAVQAQQSPSQRAIQQATLEHLVAQTNKENTLAAYYASEAARNRQSANVSAAIPTAVDVGPFVKNVPDEVIHGDPRNPAQTAGVHPGMTRYKLPGGITLHGPSQAMHDSFEDIPLAAWPFIIKESERNDPQFWHKVDNFLFDGAAQRSLNATRRELDLIKRVFRTFRPRGIPHRR